MTKAGWPSALVAFKQLLFVTTAKSTRHRKQKSRHVFMILFHSSLAGSRIYETKGIEQRCQTPWSHYCRSFNYDISECRPVTTCCTPTGKSICVPVPDGQDCHHFTYKSERFYTMATALLDKVIDRPSLQAIKALRDSRSWRYISNYGVAIQQIPAYQGRQRGWLRHWDCIAILIASNLAPSKLSGQDGLGGANTH